jgi:hypothetical protein
VCKNTIIFPITLYDVEINEFLLVGNDHFVRIVIQIAFGGDWVADKHILEDRVGHNIYLVIGQ